MATQENEQAVEDGAGAELVTSECPPPPFYYKEIESSPAAMAPPNLENVPIDNEQEEIAKAGGDRALALQRFLQKQSYGERIYAMQKQRTYNSATGM